MAKVEERLGIVETKVINLGEKLDDLKVDVKDMHDCLDKTREDLKGQLTEMYDASCSRHAALAEEINAFKSQRDKWIWTGAGIIAAMGWVSGHTEVIAKIFG